jgi:hypothetical protein
MPENCDGKNTAPDTTKFTLVAHHEECTTPISSLMLNDGTRNKSTGI